MTTVKKAYAAISAFPPELLEPIVHDLEPSDLYNCTITNREWYQAFNTYLWQHIRLKVPASKDVSPTPLEQFRAAIEGGALVNRGHMVETLEVEYYEALGLLDSDPAVATAKHGDNSDIKNDLETDNDNDEVNKKDETEKQELQSARAYKPVCTDIRRLHVGSAPDPACITTANISAFPVITTYPDSTTTRHQTSSLPSPVYMADRRPIYPTPDVPGRMTPFNFTPATHPRPTTTTPSTSSTFEMVAFGGPVVFGEPVPVVSSVSLTAAPALAPPSSAATTTPTASFFTTAPITPAAAESPSSIIGLFDATRAAGIPIPGFGSKTTATPSSFLGAAPTTLASGSTNKIASAFGAAPFATTTPFPAFGSTNTSTGLFGNTPSTTTTGAFGAIPSSTTTSIFGIAPSSITTSVFGNAPSTTTTGLFSAAPSSTATGIFGVVTSSITTTTTTTTSNVFGVAPSLITTNVFRNAPSTTSTSLFENAPSTTSASVFGVVRSSTTTSVSGFPSSTITSVFGVTPSTATTGLFGTPPTTGGLFGIPPTTGGLFETAPTTTATPGTAILSTAGSSFEADRTSSSLFNCTTNPSHTYQGFGHPDYRITIPTPNTDTSHVLTNKKKSLLLDHHLDLSFLVSLLRQNNQLRMLSLQGRILDPFGCIIGDIADVFAALPASLESLRLNGFRGMSLLSDMKLSATQFREFEILHQSPEQWQQWHSRCLPSLPSPLPSLKTLPFLRTIRIVSCRFNISHLVPLFTRCPNLQALRLSSNDRNGIPANVATALRDSCPRLNELGLSGHLGFDENISLMISASTCGWVTLSLLTLAPYGFESHTVANGTRRENFFGSRSTDALLKHAPTLENLHLDGAIGFQSRDIHRLLCSAPRLKWLQLMADSNKNAYDARLEATDLVDFFSPHEQWVCRSIEYFACGIIRAPRPDLEQNAMVNPLSPGLEAAMERSYQVHRKIYSRFAELTRLKVLIFGGKSSNRANLFGNVGLPMSLESGLDLLANLKELEHVDCDRATTKFWQYEVQEWAKANWPKYSHGSSVANEFWQRGGYLDDGTGTFQDPFSDSFLFSTSK